jgi:hypothetical protein
MYLLYNKGGPQTGSREASKVGSAMSPGSRATWSAYLRITSAGVGQLLFCSVRMIHDVVGWLAVAANIRSLCCVAVAAKLR